MISKKRLPSIGFVCVCIAYVSTASFFAWGFSTPPLDRIWVLDKELKIGEKWKLSKQDERLFRRQLDLYPELAESLLSETQIGVISAQREGWIETPEVTILRTPQAGEFKYLVLNVQTPPEHLPLKVTIKGREWKEKLHVDRHERRTVELPPSDTSELIVLELDGKKLRADSSVLGVHVSFAKEQP